MLIAETIALTKKYRNTKALDNLTISLQENRIYGLIGQNGAGKTTLMRILAGLSFPDEGSIRLFGESDEKGLRKMRRRIGFMIENPGIDLSMTAKENMTMQRYVYGIPNEKWEDELLELVGLKDTGKKKTRNFSLGMKQRLGIAMGLVSNPDFLVLDEPINGLDPIGVVEVRNLLKRLCEERKICILISSHNLAELYQTATDYIIIDRGRLVKLMTLADLDDQCREYVLVKCPDPQRLVSLLEQTMGLSEYLVMPDNTVRVYNATERIDEIGQIIHQNDIALSNLSVQGDTLENYYMKILRGVSNV